MPYPTLPTTYTAPAGAEMGAHEIIRASTWADIAEAQAHLYAGGVRTLGGDSEYRTRTITAAAWTQAGEFTCKTGANVYRATWHTKGLDGHARLTMTDGATTRTITNTHAASPAKEDVIAGVIAVNPETEYTCTVDVLDFAANMELHFFLLVEVDLSPAEL